MITISDITNGQVNRTATCEIADLYSTLRPWYTGLAENDEEFCLTTLSDLQDRLQEGIPWSELWKDYGTTLAIRIDA